MESINAQTIIAAILAAARVAPEYPDAAIDAAMPQGVPYGFEIVPDWEGTACRTYPPSSQYYYHNLAIERMQDAARAELRAMLDIPAFVRIRTSERGSMRIVNTSARLNQFAATVRTNARAFGGGLAPARRAPAAVKAWPAGPVKLVAELLQDNMPADATALALQRCGASFYDTGKGAFMVWAPMSVEGLPDGLISVRSSASGRYVVQCSKSGFSVGSTGATRRAAEESARQAVADAGPEKTAAAMAAARPCDIDAARAAWFKIHGIDAAAEVADMSETATPEPVADVAAEVSAFVASMAAIADAMQGPADAAPAVNPEPVAELAGHGAEVAPMMAGQAVASMPAAGGLADAGGSGPGWPAGPAAGRRVAGGSDAGPENAEPVGIAGTRGNSEGNPQPVGISDGRRFEVDGHDYRQAFENSDDAMRAAMGCVYLNPARFGFHSAELSRTGCTAWTYGFSTVQVRAVRADGVADGQAVTFNAARREWVGTATIDATEPAADVAPAADPEPVGIAYATGDGGQFTTSADACRHAANLANTSGLIVSVEAVQPAAPVEPVEISDVWGTDAEPHAIPGPDGNPVREWIRGAVCQVACAARISYRAAGIMAAPHAETLRAAHVAGASVHDGARIVLDASAGPADPQPVENVAPAVEAPQEAPEPVQAAQVSPKPARLDAAPFQAMRQALKSGGVQAVAVPQLFATPAALAARMVELAGLEHGARVLEPSAGTGRLINAIRETDKRVTVCAVEINRQLCTALAQSPNGADSIHCADFLCITGPAGYVSQSESNPGPMGAFDAVIMNPPFIGGADIKHIKHALQFLKPGGRLVAICAGGPRQAAELRPMVDAMGGTWEPLPADTFRESGTGVNTVLLCVEAPDVARQDPPEPVAKPEPMAKPAHMQPVKVADYRRAADHLMRLALSDYCACVNDGERQQWARIASRVMSEYDGMQCARASSQDVERFAQALEAVNSRLGKVSPEPVKNGPPVEEVKPAADLDAQLLAMRAAEAGPVPESLESLLRRYAAVRLVLYRASMQDERSAQIATQFACDDLMAQYRRTLREGGHEVDALAYVRMEAEDMERAARNTGLQASAPSASAAEPEPDPEAAPAVTIEAMHAFLALHYRPDRFTDRDGPTWGARYSWEVARSALEHLATHGHGQIGHHETRTGLSIHYDAALQVFDDAAMEPTTATAGQVQAWSARHFRAVLDWLEDMNHHGEALLIRALRAGSGSLAASVRGLIRDHLAAGYLRPELAARRNELAARVQALEAGR